MKEIQLEIQFPDRLGYSIRRSARAKNPSVSVCLHDGVVLTLPKRFDERRVPALLEEWHPWIQSQVARFESQRAEMPSDMTAELPASIRLPACNRTWQVSYRNSEQAKTCVTERGDKLIVDSPAHESLQARLALKRWLTRTARSHLLGVLESLATQHGFAYKRLTIRTQRTRWGSCSSTGTISLNCLLMFLPPDCAASVALHELCHTRYMSHGPRFYGLLQRLEPRYPTLDKQVQEGWKAIPAWAWPTRSS